MHRRLGSDAGAGDWPWSELVYLVLSFFINPIGASVGGLGTRHGFVGAVPGHLHPRVKPYRQRKKVGFVPRPRTDAEFPLVRTHPQAERTRAEACKAVKGNRPQSRIAGICAAVPQSCKPRRFCSERGSSEQSLSRTLCNLLLCQLAGKGWAPSTSSFERRRHVDSGQALACIALLWSVVGNAQ